MDKRQGHLQPDALLTWIARTHSQHKLAHETWPVYTIFALGEVILRLRSPAVWCLIVVIALWGRRGSRCKEPLNTHSSDLLDAFCSALLPPTYWGLATPANCRLWPELVILSPSNHFASLVPLTLSPHSRGPDRC